MRGFSCISARGSCCLSLRAQGEFFWCARGASAVHLENILLLIYEACKSAAVRCVLGNEEDVHGMKASDRR